MAPAPPLKLMGGLGETAQLTNHTYKAKLCVVGMQMLSSFCFTQSAISTINN